MKLRRDTHFATCVKVSAEGSELLRRMLGSIPVPSISPSLPCGCICSPVGRLQAARKGLTHYTPQYINIADPDSLLASTLAEQRQHAEHYLVSRYVIRDLIPLLTGHSTRLKESQCFSLVTPTGQQQSANPTEH